jgi:hypothetical protein
VKVKEGIEGDPARAIVSGVKAAKLKVQAQIQDAQVRVTGKNRDDLQKAIAHVRGLDMDIELRLAYRAPRRRVGRFRAVRRRQRLRDRATYPESSSIPLRR